MGLLAIGLPMIRSRLVVPCSMVETCCDLGRVLGPNAMRWLFGIMCYLLARLPCGLWLGRLVDGCMLLGSIPLKGFLVP